ncbi:FxsA family protein [Niallia nealsonii]|uniref:Exclusion suppressor FxsA n=1 Tax=Niallia nealsonii TaxID=115979 RepID=A0A2N0Z648_9BACI|nr:FxsA family protein [Niallia nealsonii]PKG24998.1 exclusion suppressor FxsA [Niallia nealsonii]
MRYFLIVLLCAPVVEIAVFLLAGKVFGIAETLIFIIGTGLIGGYLLKKQGFKAYKNVQEKLHSGQLPGETILDGLCVLAGGVLLVLPGFLSDIAGAFILFPPTKKLVKRLLLQSMQRKLQKKNRITIIH